MLSIFLSVYWPPVSLLWRSVYLDLLPILGLLASLFMTLADDAIELFEKNFFDPLICNFMKLYNFPSILDIVLVRILQRNRTSKLCLYVS